ARGTGNVGWIEDVHLALAVPDEGSDLGPEVFVVADVAFVVGDGAARQGCVVVGEAWKVGHRQRGHDGFGKGRDVAAGNVAIAVERARERVPQGSAETSGALVGSG